MSVHSNNNSLQKALKATGDAEELGNFVSTLIEDDLLDQHDLTKGSLIHFLLDKNNDLQLLKILVHIEGLDVNALDKRGKTVLSYAIEKKEKEKVEFLLKVGATVSLSELADLISLLKGVKKKELSFQGTFRFVVGEDSINRVTDIKFKNKIVRKFFEETKINLRLNDNTYLNFAAMLGDMQAVQAFIEFGFKVNGQDKEGNSAMHYAAAEGHLDILKLLVEHGGNLDVKNGKGNTPAEVASIRKHLNIVAFIENRQKACKGVF